MIAKTTARNAAVPPIAYQRPLLNVIMAVSNGGDYGVSSLRKIQAIHRAVGFFLAAFGGAAADATPGLAAAATRKDTFTPISGFK